MFEKLYARLFRLYPSRFRRDYEGEALQLIRDRLRDETGFVQRTRLFWDLAVDAIVGLPRAYRSFNAATEAASLSLKVEGGPCFKVLDEEPIGPASILLGSSLSLATIVAFGFLLSRSMAHLPVPGSNGPTSPIEAVVERLNRPTTSDTPVIAPEEASTLISGERRPRPSLESGHMVAGQKHIDSVPTQSTNERAMYLTPQLPAAEAGVWRGTLTDAFGRPVRSADIHVIGGHGELVARTVADGRFAFSGLTSGEYEVVVVLAGREVAHRQAVHLGATSSPSRLTLASGGRLLVSRPGELP
jgi:Carboxypeptidase regulatory-like domain